MKMMLLFPALVAGTISYQVAASENIGQAEIRELVRRGEIMPLETILAQFPPREFGKLLDLEVEREHGAVIYEFEFLRADGRIVEVEVDARNGKILEQETED
ncbi:MAG: peptidase M4 [Gammaproteobacteria bacterium]|nr:peptidase M4 [Gammaproteobacteria bacterium]